MSALMVIQLLRAMFVNGIIGILLTGPTCILQGCEIKPIDNGVVDGTPTPTPAQPPGSAPAPVPAPSRTPCDRCFNPYGQGTQCVKMTDNLTPCSGCVPKTTGESHCPEGSCTGKLCKGRAQGASELLVMTYNLLYSSFNIDYPAHTCSLKTTCEYRDGDRCAQHEEINKWSAAVIGMQEAGPKYCAEMLCAKAGPSFKTAEGGEPLVYNSDKVELTPNSHGHTSLEPYCDTWSCRGFGWAKYKMKGENFVFWHFNIHMTHEHKEDDKGNRIYNPKGYQGKIAERMIAKWKELSPCGEPMVITGDFNPHKDMVGGMNAAEKVLVSNGLKKLSKQSRRDNDICQDCDNIFYTDNHFEVIAHETGMRSGSDHTPQIATLKPKNMKQC